MMEEEKQSEHQPQDDSVDDPVSNSISYGLLPMPDMSGEKNRAGSIADTHIDSDVKDELANMF